MGQFLISKPLLLGPLFLQSLGIDLLLLSSILLLALKICVALWFSRHCSIVRRELLRV